MESLLSPQNNHLGNTIKFGKISDPTGNQLSGLVLQEIFVGILDIFDLESQNTTKPLALVLSKSRRYKRQRLCGEGKRAGLRKRKKVHNKIDQ